jgi:arginine decarboxylase
MVDSIRSSTEESIQAGLLTKQEAKIFLRHYEEGLAGYTYLEDGD